MANEVIPYFEPGGNFTGKGKEALVGRRFAKLDAAATPLWAPEGLKTNADPNVVLVKMADAGEQPIGVIQKDVANDKLVTIMGVPGAIYPVTSGGALNPGDAVQSGADGKAIIRAAGIACGVAMSKVTAADQIVAVKFLPSAGV